MAPKSDILFINSIGYRNEFAKLMRIDVNGCWRWRHATDKDGYPIYSEQVGYRQTITVRAHRACYMAYRGPIIAQLDHTCKIKDCINPSHLEDTTAKINSRRSKGWYLKDNVWHCKRGHAILDDDTDMYRKAGTTHTQCRACTIEKGLL